MKKEYAKLCFRYGLVYLLCALWGELLFKLPSFYNGVQPEGQFNAAVGVTVAAFFFYAYLRVTVIYDRSLRERYMAGNIPDRLRERCGFLFAQKRFWIELAGWLCLYILLPLKRPGEALSRLFLQDSAAYIGKVFLLPGMLILGFLLSFKAHLSAMNYWDAYRQGYVAIHERVTKGKKRKRQTSEYAGAAGAVIIRYLVIGAAVDAFFPMLFSYVMGFQELFTLPNAILAAAAILLFYLFRYGRAYVKRRAFMKRLASICRSEKYQTLTAVYPYRSLFGMYDGESIRIKAGDREYSCKFVSGVRRRVAVQLYPNGVCSFIKEIKLFRIDLSRPVKTYVYGWEADCPKILILNPAPYRVCEPGGNELDNGDRVGEYKVFTGPAFLNALERDCLDR